MGYMKPPVNFKSLLKRRHTITAVFILFFLCVLIPKVNASVYNLTDLDDAVADVLGISSFTGGLLISFIILLFPTLCIAWALAKSKGPTVMYALIIVDFCVMGFLVALGWLEYWIFLIVALLIALLLAGAVRGLITKGD